MTALIENCILRKVQRKHVKVNNCLENLSYPHQLGKIMLRNCFLPVNYNKPVSQTCGEIICENVDVFIINCKLCKIKIFEFEEFVQHFKNAHWEKSKANSSTERRPERNQNYEQLIKLEIAEVDQDKSETNDREKYESSGENEELWDIENYAHSDNDYNNDDAHTELEEDHQADEEQCRIIIEKVILHTLSLYASRYRTISRDLFALVQNLNVRLRGRVNSCNIQTHIHIIQIIL